MELEEFLRPFYQDLDGASRFDEVERISKIARRLYKPASPDAGPLREVEVEPERWVLCVACGGRLARETARIEVDGSHEHSFMNPSGIRFTVACFAAAPGCVPDGEPSDVWTWFPGRAWQIALCKTCRSHVGWSFHAPLASPFHALVSDRIASEASG